MTDSSSSTHDETLAATAAVGLGETMAAVGLGERTPSYEHPRLRLERGSLVGRYVVLSKLGAGGMGQVFAVYDPELDRKVALKLLHPQLAADADPITARAAQARLVREAQALARLNHPHIVAVHDVGEHQGAVWLAMEYVDGETLSAWLKRRRTWREVLEVLTPAARGLSAAHAAGLVHRDIKPDNLMIGRDGRVRVMDLGLARALGGEEPAAGVSPDGRTAAARDLAGLAARVTQVGAVLGTPAYMSPEQFRGAPVDARADVFSFCVTLWEALMGERPFAGATLVELAASVLAGKVRPVPREARDVPGWLRRVCLRGLATEPGQRFASMDALLDALSGGRARARARRWLVGAAALAGLGASAALYQRLDRAERIAACERAGAGIFEVWNDGARARVRDGIAATGLSYATVTAEKVLPFLDAQAEAWNEHRTRACLAAEVEATLDAEHQGRALWCLDERRSELAALLTELSHADDMVVQKAVTAAAGLPPVSPCTDRQVLAALPSPPPPDAREQADAVRTTLSQVRTLLAAGKYAAGLARAREAVADAEALDWPPMIAAARQLEGALFEMTGDYLESEAASLSAYMAAAKVQAWDLAASAAIQLAYTVGYKQARHAEGMVWAGHAGVAVSFAGDPLGLREASRLNELALLHASTGAYAEAKALNERALAIREKALGPDHPGVANSLNNLAIVHSNLGTYAEARALYQRALAIREKALGPDHPLVAMNINNLALVYVSTGAYAEAKALHERALAVQEKVLGPEHSDVALSLGNLANVQTSIGAYAEAKALNERALAIQEKALGPDHPGVARTLSNLADVHMNTGAYAEAKALYERALAIQEKVLGPGHPDVALSLSNLANVHRSTGAYAEAKALLERALAIQEEVLGPGHPDVALSLSHLANIHSITDARAEAKALHERALAIREKALGPGHPDVARSLNHLALVHGKSGGYAEAKALYGRALAILEESLGPGHPDVAMPLKYLADVHSSTGAPAEAKALYERALAIQEKALGPDHPSVALSLSGLASIHHDMGAPAEAKALYERALAIREKALGPDHPLVATVLTGLARMHNKAGAYAEAKPLYERALAIREKAFGPAHSDVALTLGYLGDLALAQGRPAEALPLLERAVSILDAHEGVQTNELDYRFSLAKTLVLTRGDRNRALAEARKAVDGFRAAGEGKAEELAEAEAFLARHGSTRH